MFKKVEGENSDLIVLNEPIQIPNSENTIEFFELEKLNNEEEFTIGTFNIFRDLFIESNINLKEFDVLKNILSNEYVTLKYKISYEGYINLKLILEYYRLDELYKTECFDEEIDLNGFMEDIISSIKLNYSFFINNNKFVCECVEKFKKDLFLGFLKEGMYIEISNELLLDAEIYQYINGEKKLFAICNRVIIDYERLIVCLCEVLKPSKFNYDNINYNIRINIGDGKELIFKNIPLIQNINKEISYTSFDLNVFKKFNDNIFIKNIEDEYIKIKVNNLNYVSYEDYNKLDISGGIKNNNDYDDYNDDENDYNSQTLLKMSEYLYRNNSDNVIKKYIKANKIKSIKNIDLNNYLLYREMFL